jgi:hypothetical protein
MWMRTINLKVDMRCQIHNSEGKRRRKNPKSWMRISTVDQEWNQGEVDLVERAEVPKRKQRCLLRRMHGK